MKIFAFIVQLLSVTLPSMVSGVCVCVCGGWVGGWMGVDVGAHMWLYAYMWLCLHVW